jgi:hypothetical protein
MYFRPVCRNGAAGEALSLMDSIWQGIAGISAVADMNTNSDAQDCVWKIAQVRAWCCF